MAEEGPQLQPQLPPPVVLPAQPDDAGPQVVPQYNTW